MDKAKIALLAVIALLLLLFLIDRNRQPRQMKAFIEKIEEAQSNLTDQQDELRDLIAELKEKGVSFNADSQTDNQQQVVQTDPNRDGKQKLNVNFLLPIDDSHFQRKWIGGTLKQFESSPKGFNPILSSSATASDLHALTNDTLCTQHPKHPQLWSEGLATSCVISNDYKRYVFHLRDNVFWHVPPLANKHGFEWLKKRVKLTAHDFKAYYDVIMNPDVECPHLKSYYEDVESVNVISDHVLEVNWKTKVFTSLSFSMGLEPLPRHVYYYNAEGELLDDAELGVAFNKHWFDEHLQVIGVGAYELDQYIPDKITSFKRNKKYWGKHYHFDAIEWDAEVRKPEPKWVSFQNGDVHFDGLTPTKYKSEILDHNEKKFAAFDKTNVTAGRQGEFGWERVKSSSYSYIGWNMRKPLFKEKLVRQAMTHAFPKQRIIDEVYYGLGRPQKANVHPDSIYFNDKLPEYGYDLDKARALLDKAGWKDTDGDGIRDKMINGKSVKFDFVIKYYANSVEWDSTLIIYKNELLKIGIKMNPINFEWKELLRVYQDKDFEAVSGGWRFGLEVDFNQVWHSKFANEPRSSNHCGFVNKRADAIAEALRAEFDQDERVRLAQEFQAIVHEEQPYTFFRSGEGIFIWQNKKAEGLDVKPVEGVTYGFDNYHPLKSRNRLMWHFDK